MAKPILDIEYYKEQRDYLKKQFEMVKTGYQRLLQEQTRLFQPILKSQKAIQDSLAESRDSKKVIAQQIQGQLQPFVQEFQRWNDFLDMLQYLPYYNAPAVEEMELLHAHPSASVADNTATPFRVTMLRDSDLPTAGSHDGPPPWGPRP